MALLPIFWILLGACFALTRFSRSYLDGACASMFLLLAIPETCRISLPLFDLTFQRVILIVWTCYWLRNRNRVSPGLIPASQGLAALSIIYAIVVVFSIDRLPSVKYYIAFLFEGIVFYFIVSELLNTEAAVYKFSRALVAGGISMAVVGLLQRYLDLNVVRYLDGFSPAYTADVISIFRHRIISGYAVGLLVPLALAWIYLSPHGKRLRFWFASLALALVCYLSNSRGPWFCFPLTLAVAGVIDRQMRRFAVTILILASLAVVLRPGVRNTIVNLVEATFDSSSHRGRSYAYRNELWRVAWIKINESPGRFLFGYGLLSTESMDLYDYFEFGGNSIKLGYSSWDSQYAGNLIETGILGFGVEALIYLYLIAFLWKGRHTDHPKARVLYAAAMAGFIGYLWAMTNVWVFGVQLKFIFWSMVAIACRTGPLSVFSMDQSPAPVPASTDDEDFVHTAPAISTGISQ